jgi:hypothetical protein
MGSDRESTFLGALLRLPRQEADFSGASLGSDVGVPYVWPNLPGLDVFQVQDVRENVQWDLKQLKDRGDPDGSALHAVILGTRVRLSDTPGTFALGWWKGGLGQRRPPLYKRGA